VRSRDAGMGRGRDRDLIEAGLSEPAEWRSQLWGLCLRGPVREPPSAEAGADLGHRIASGRGDCGRQRRAWEMVLLVIAADPTTCRIGALTANATVPAGAIGVRWRKSSAGGWQSHHEVSSQKDVRQGAGRARTASMTMAPPQVGHRSGGCDGMDLFGGRFLRWRVEQPATERELGGALAVGEEAVVADAMEAIRQAVQ
jgi:hypothetical protein